MFGYTKLDKLFAELFENDKKIGIMEDYIDKVAHGELPDKPTYLTEHAHEMYTNHYRLTNEITIYIRDYVIASERSKSRFKRLFNR